MRGVVTNGLAASSEVRQPALCRRASLIESKRSICGIAIAADTSVMRQFWPIMA